MAVDSQSYYQSTIELFQDSSWRNVAERLLDTYPHYPYHKIEHGLDVMRSVVWLMEQMSKREEVVDHQQTMILAAAAHDAGFTHNTTTVLQHPQGKEGVSIQLFRTICQQSNVIIPMTEQSIISKAILGTIVRPGEEQRDTIWAWLLHVADISTLWCEPEAFMNYTARCWVEEFSELPWKQFVERDIRFMGRCCDEVYRGSSEFGIASELTDRLVQQILRNQDQLRATAQVSAPETYADWPYRWFW